MALGLPVGTDDATALIAGQLAPLGRALLVLDGCEAVLDGTASLAASLLAACPALTLVVTSRVPLSVETERVIGIAAFPPPGYGSWQELAASDHVRLLADRARRRRRGAGRGRGDRAVRGRAVPPLRRPAAGDRAGGRAAGRHVRARPARPPARACRRAAPTGCAPSPRAATRCSTRTRRRCSGGWRCSTDRSRCRSCGRWWRAGRSRRCGSCGSCAS